MVKGRRARTYSRVKLNLISDSVLGSLRSYYEDGIENVIKKKRF